MNATRLIGAALAATASIALAACASTSHRPDNPPDALAAPAAPGSANSRSAAPPPADPRAVMVDLAVSMIGQQYRFGGAAPGGFDCSGLVAYAAGGAGIRVPRTALEQFGAGMPVARGELQMGDLVFLHLAHKELHVGIAIDGDRFVHAPSTGGRVRIDSLDAPAYSRGFLGARRIFVVP